MSIWELLKYPGVMPVLLIYNYVMLLAYTFTAVFPVTQYTPVKLGGFGFSPGYIAASTGLNGISQAIWLLLVFPFLHKRIGTGGLLSLCAVAWPVLFAAFPVSNFLLRHGQTTLFWATVPPMLAFFCGVSMAFSKYSLVFIPDDANVHISLCTTCTQRHLALSRDSWNHKRYCACGSKRSSICCSCGCDEFVCHWCQISHPRWSAILALPGHPGVWALCSLAIPPSQGKRRCKVQVIERRCMIDDLE